jgi:hypothetical protein
LFKTTGIFPNFPDFPNLPDFSYLRKDNRLQYKVYFGFACAMAGIKVICIVIPAVKP